MSIPLPLVTNIPVIFTGFSVLVVTSAPTAVLSTVVVKLRITFLPIFVALISPTPALVA